MYRKLRIDSIVSCSDPDVIYTGYFSDVIYVSYDPKFIIEVNKWIVEFFK